MNRTQPFKSLGLANGIRLKLGLEQLNGGAASLDGDP